VLFRSAATWVAPADIGPTLSVDDIRAAWEAPDAAHRPVALIADFPLDVELSLTALAQRSEPVRWIDGESLLEPDWPTPSFGRPARTNNLADLPPGLLLVDFSSVQPERLLPDDAAYADPVSAGNLLEALMVWSEWRGHRVALGPFSAGSHVMVCPFSLASRAMAAGC